MLIRFSEERTQVEALVGKRPILAASGAIDALRELSGQSLDSLSTLEHFLPRAALEHDLPVAMLMYRGGTLFGAIFLQVRRRFGVPTGLVKSGNLIGQGSVVAAEADRVLVLEVASRILLRRSLAHTVVLSALFPGQTGLAPSSRVAGINAQWHFREVRSRLDLSGGLDATLMRLGYKMRRNLRASRRRAESTLGLRFLPDLDPEQRRQAVEALCDQGRYPIAAERARDVDAMLLSTPGHFAIGLTDGAGEWLSYIAGWRDPLGTYVDRQLSSDGHERLSLSTLMRGYLVEHEVGRRSPAIIFVGGTSPLWSQACEPVACGDLLATREGYLGRLIRTIACRLSPTGQVAQLHARSGS